ncbi:MAG: T9SS type A sorting domain-containing protein [Chitinophagaceae bacterium]|nr:T9SS type A sorting domain-containing protein [Chitinophagaceae bacterium]
MKKKFMVAIMVLLACIDYSFGQSRGIKYTYPGADEVRTPPNWASNESTTFEMANENVMIFTPVVRRGTNFFSVLSQFDNNLCYKGSRKVSIPNGNEEFYNGVSRTDGGFAVHSWRPPYIIRSYDNQGNFVWAKRVVDANNYNSLNTDYPKMVANPNNNNLFFAYREYSDETNDSIPNLLGSLLINVIEIAPNGALVNTFQYKLPYDARYIYSGTPVCHTFAYGPEISDIKYVKGSFGPASDRIWISLNLTPHGSYEIDANYQITTNQIFGALPLQNYSAVFILNPYPGASGGDACLLTDNPATPDPTLVQSKDAQGFGTAQMMLMTVESQVPHIYKFNDHNYAIPNIKYKFPFSVTTGGGLSQYGDLKNHQGNILFSIERYFGLFNPGNLQVNLRRQNSNNFNAYGVVNFNERNTSKLYINYNNGNGFPVMPGNYLIRETIADFKVTCESSPVSISSAVTKPFAYLSLKGGSDPYSGISLVNEPYAEVDDYEMVRSRDVCLRCVLLNKPAVSINESTDVLIYPNPSTSYFKLAKGLAIKNVAVYSMTGQLIRSFRKQYQYSIADLTKGSYLVKIETSNGVLKKTLIVE